MGDNIFCSKDCLKSEKSVENFFVNRLIDSLGFPDKDLQFDSSIESLEIPKGHKKVRYRPDVVLYVGGIPRMIIETKAPNKNPLNSLHQAFGYVSIINSRYDTDNPIKYYVITNGLQTYIYFYDSIFEFLSISFEEWSQDNPLVKRILKFFSYNNFSQFGKDFSETQSLGLVEGLLCSGAVSQAAISRFVMMAESYPMAMAVNLDYHIWHRKAYSELLGLDLIETMPNGVHHRELYNKTMDPERYGKRIPSEIQKDIGFTLTKAGRSTGYFFVTNPILMGEYHKLFSDFLRIFHHDWNVLNPRFDPNILENGNDKKLERVIWDWRGIKQTS